MKPKYSCECYNIDELVDTPELLDGARLEPTNGIFTYRINNFSPDISRAEVETIIDEALNFWEDYIGIPFIYIETEVPNLEFNFATNKERNSPLRFKKGVLAYAFAPADGTSTVWINDKYDWARQDGFALFKVLVHEIGHSLNLKHSPDPDCVTYFQYNPAKEVNLTENSLNTIERMYPS